MGNRLWLLGLFCSVFLSLVVDAQAQINTAPAGQKGIKIKIEAPELDKSLLLQKLNQHGADHALRFESADQGFDYRIEFGTFQHKNTAATLAGAGAVHFSGAKQKCSIRRAGCYSPSREKRVIQTREPQMRLLRR